MHLILWLHGLLVVAFTLRILLRDDLSPPARLAWFVVLMLLPYVGSAAYILFGEVDIGHRANALHQRVLSEIREKAGRFMGDAGAPGIDPLYLPAFRYAGSINGFHTVGGNRAELLADDTVTLERLIADIDGAQSQVHVLSYIWLQDTTGTALAQALMRAAARGVTCRAMADGLGSRAMIRSALWRGMRAAGVQTAVALPLDRPIRTLLTSRMDLRNHRKIAVIDGGVTYCGSRNAADPEFLVKRRYAPWVDIMLRIEGPVVTQNQILFASDWMQATGESLDVIALNDQPAGPGFPAQVVGDGPTERRGATPQLFAGLMAVARDRLTLSTPYFVPDATVLEALSAAALRGVRVRLIFPARNDSRIVAAASRSYYRKLLEAGCEIHEFRDGLLHAKTLTVDGRVSLIGSSNLDLRSFDLNYENNILLQDDAVTAAIMARQESYLHSADAVTLAEVLRWPWYRRIWHNVVATIGPIL